MELAASVRGFGLGFSLIAAIGAQNAYVLTRGILHNHHWTVALVCSILDALLISAGILGMGSLIRIYPGLVSALTAFGALFLFAYGLFAFRRMFRSEVLGAESKRVSRLAAVTTVLALSLLNPHVYLDTVILIGSISVRELPSNRMTFGMGAALASFVWFFCLALGGQWLQRWFQTPAAWRVLDAIVGIVMWALAVSLVQELL
ncbi:MAG: LysE/ArgO family amino acid transporter [Arenicellales bacterium]